MLVTNLNELRYVEFGIRGVIAISQHWRDGRTWSCLKDSRPDNGVHLITRGCVRYTLEDGSVLEAGKGDVIYLPQYGRYSCEFTTDGTSEFVRTILVNFRLEDVDHRPFVLSPTVTCLGHDTTGELKAAFQDLRNTYRSTQNNLLIKSLLLALLNKIAAQEIDPLGDMEHCGDYIRQNLTLDLSVNRLAEMYHVSETTFRKRFKEIYGVTPARFINDRKMELACELLCAGDITTEEIVRLLGFYDTPYFYKRMKAELGMTPADFRRTHRRRLMEGAAADEEY